VNLGKGRTLLDSGLVVSPLAKYSVAPLLLKGVGRRCRMRPDRLMRVLYTGQRPFCIAGVTADGSVFGSAGGYIAIGIGNSAFLSILPGKANHERVEAKSLDETFDVDFQMSFVNIEAFCHGHKPSF